MIATTSEHNYALAAVAALRLAGLGAAFQLRWAELLILTAMYASREWAQLLAAAQEAAEEIIASTLPRAFGGGAAEPLTGRRKVASRRSRSIVINFPDRRAPTS